MYLHNWLIHVHAFCSSTYMCQGPDQTALILTLGLSTTSIQNLRVNMLWSVNGTAKCIPVILFLPVYFFLISSWLGQDFYIITRPKSYFPYLPYLPLWAYFPGRNIPANSTGKYRGWNLPLNLATVALQKVSTTTEIRLKTPKKHNEQIRFWLISTSLQSLSEREICSDGAVILLCVITWVSSVIFGQYMHAWCIYCTSF